MRYVLPAIFLAFACGGSQTSSPSPSTVAPVVPPPGALTAANQTLSLSWADLSFDYVEGEALPPHISALDGQRIEIDGMIMALGAGEWAVTGLPRGPEWPIGESDLIALYIDDASIAEGGVKVEGVLEASVVMRDGAFFSLYRMRAPTLRVTPRALSRDEEEAVERSRIANRRMLMDDHSADAFGIEVVELVPTRPLGLELVNQLVWNEQEVLTSCWEGRGTVPATLAVVDATFTVRGTATDVTPEGVHIANGCLVEVLEGLEPLPVGQELDGRRFRITLTPLPTSP